MVYIRREVYDETHSTNSKENCSPAAMRASSKSILLTFLGKRGENVLLLLGGVCGGGRPYLACNGKGVGLEKWSF